ncbi:hypothetical protein [Tenacibaculum piscium]|nr:hypothetical protein [Tenacibaculum piscium]
MNINFRIIPTKEILTILPLLKKANTKTPHDILKERVLEMANYPTYECIGLFDADLLIGITGLW